MNFYNNSNNTNNTTNTLDLGTNIKSFPNYSHSQNNSKKNNKNPLKIDFDILSNMNKAQFIDSSINKFYTKYLQEQAIIQHDQKIYELIEKSNEPKIFNSLRANFIKEQNELKNMNNIIKTRNKVTDNISSVNLSNCNKKLYSIYKLSGEDLGFMTSFMHHLGNRPQKVYKPKVNKKIEALSMGKLGNFLKNKDKDKNEHNKKYSLKALLKKLENENSSSNNNNNINNINQIEENKIIHSESKKDIKNFINNTNNHNDYLKVITNKQFLKKKTMNMNTKNIKLFRNERINNTNVNTNYSSKKYVNNNFNIKKYSVNYNELYQKYVSKSKEESLNEESKEEKKTEINNFKNYYLKTSKFNNIITTSDTINNINTISNIRDSIINKEKENKLNIVNINIEDSLSNDTNEKKTERDNNTDSFVNNKNNNEEKNKILKMYKTSMNEFLQKVKQEGNILNKTSHKLSSLLYKLKKENFETFQNERNKTKNQILNQKNYKTTYNQNNIEEKLGKKKLGKTFYKRIEKSRFRIPYINKIVYGENNFYDTFEKLQKELYTEVKSQIKHTENINKKKKKKVVNVVGVEVLNKLIREDSDDELKKELFEMNKKQSKDISSTLNKAKN